MPPEAAIRWPPKRARRRVLRDLWTAPTTALGHLLGFALTRRRPIRVEGEAAAGWFYPLEPSAPTGPISAVTIGHVVLFRRDRLAGLVGRTILAHELAHTRQHDILGPLYLPLHLAAEIASVIKTRAEPTRGEGRSVHRHNPLEERHICLPSSACRPIGQGLRSCPGGTDTYLARLGMDEATYRRLVDHGRRPH